MLRSTTALQSSFRTSQVLRSFYTVKGEAVEKPELSDTKIKNIRNIGIAAHIDAGKTTTTERMLYYAGVTKKIGDVDSGTTTTDYMSQEMERGITIQSAAVSMRWKDHYLNLIDTPGHVDFTVEVERSLRVVDGVVALFDAAVGVQAQSYTVLKQARKFQTPLIAFMNKMDKSNADFGKAVGTLKTKLALEPLLLETPLLKDNGEFEGTVDVIEQVSRRYTGKCGEMIDMRPLSEEPEHIRQAAITRRNNVINALTTRDDVLAEQVINALETTDGDEDAANATLSTDKLRAAVRRLTLRQEADVKHNGMPLVPVLCGASRRDMGVQPLLDAVNAYLPSPADRAKSQFGYDQDGNETPMPIPTNILTSPVIALAFKIVHTARTGGLIGADGTAGVGLEPLVFFRVYAGRVTKGMTLMNRSRNGKNEVIDKLYVLHGAHHQEVNYIGAGGIGAAFMKHAVTGDTLVAVGKGHHSYFTQVPPIVSGSAKAGGPAGGVSVTEVGHNTLPPTKSTNPVFTLEGIHPRPPTLSYAIEAANTAQSKVLDSALKMLEKEDPSLKVSVNELGQCVISGMGELHLEIILSRLEREYNLQCRLLRAIVEYTESVSEPRRFYRQVIGLPTNATSPMVEMDFEIIPDSKSSESGLEADVKQIARVEVPQTVQNGYLWYESKRERLAPEVSGEEEDAIRAQKLLASIEAHDLTYEEPSRQKRFALTELVEAINRGAKDAFKRGPLARLQMHGFVVKVNRIERKGTVPADPAQVQAAARAFFTAFLEKYYSDKGKHHADVCLMEPMMGIEINLVDSAHVPDVTALLSEKGATEVLPDEDDDRCVKGVAPMRNIARFTTELRKATKGGAYFSSNINSYRVIEQEAVVKRILTNLGVL